MYDVLGVVLRPTTLARAITAFWFLAIPKNCAAKRVQLIADDETQKQRLVRTIEYMLYMQYSKVQISLNQHENFQESKYINLMVVWILNNVLDGIQRKEIIALLSINDRWVYRMCGDQMSTSFECLVLYKAIRCD